MPELKHSLKRQEALRSGGFLSHVSGRVSGTDRHAARECVRAQPCSSSARCVTCSELYPSQVLSSALVPLTESICRGLRNGSRLETVSSDVLALLSICGCWTDPLCPSPAQHGACSRFSARVYQIAQWADPRQAWEGPSAKVKAIASNK